MAHHDVGHKIPERGLPIADVSALTVQKHLRTPDHLLEPVAQLILIPGHDRGHTRVRLYPVGDRNIGVAHQIGLPGDGIHPQIDPAQDAPFFKGLKDRNLAHLRVGRQQNMVVPADHGREVGQGPGDLPVHPVPAVGEQNHRPPGTDPVINLPDGRHRILHIQRGDIGRQGGGQQLFGGNADHGHLQAVPQRNGPEGVAQRTAARLLHDVGAQERESGLALKLAKVFQSEVEFVVADGDRVHAHRVQAFDIRLAAEHRGHRRALQQIPGHQKQCAAIFAAVFRADVTDHGGHSGDAAHLLLFVSAFDFKRHQMTVRVVEKQDRQRDRLGRHAPRQKTGATCHPKQQ